MDFDSVFVHPTAVVDDGAALGAGTKIWHFSHIMPQAVLGENCNIGQNVVVSPGVRLGNNVKVQNNVSLYTGVVCDDDVFLGPSCVFTNVTNPRSAVNRRDQYAKTHVGKGASIGANATIVCGHNIG
jgi:UDP-2-acetamido-3-amino-2,3-dideoxy-glucuronate N-acetyltransferase